MLLSSIQIQGFKSFADKTTLKFGKGITAVVGPNGSGKSNISDAVRWVLGEQSTKSLRGQSMEDVIFGGTETRRPHGFCEVTLNINNADRSLQFDNDFVSITRRYYRSHESEYLINNVAVRLKDIHELFMDTGIGRDGYSMIGQGKIDNIISSKSEERRDIFEEAAGISKYRYRKIEAERKLAAAEDNLLRLRDIMAELESRIVPLEEQSKKAEKFLELAAEKKELEIGLWLYTLENSKDALRSQESKIAAAQLRYGEIEMALAEFDAAVEQNSADFAKLTSDIEGERIKISSANEEIVKINGRISVIDNNIAHNLSSIERLESEREQLKQSDSQALIEIEAKRAESEAKSGALERLKTQLKELEAQLSELFADGEKISRKIEEQVRTLNSLSALSADKRVEMVTADTAIQEITARSDTVDRLIEERNEEFQTLNKDFADTEKLLSELEENITGCRNILNGYEIKLENRRAAAEELKQKYDNLKLDIEGKNRRVQLLSELEKNMEGFAHSVKSVMSEAGKGLLRGIHGPVSKIIKVDKKYTVAIETALGNAIQNIVVDSENDAKRAIAHLKSTNGGRATFLPLSSVKAREFKEQGIEESYGYVGIASDLVECEPRYREIIGSLLGGTVVAEDIDCAVTIAKKFEYRVKVVSLDGQVVNPGGSLTGGSLVKQAGLLSRGADIARLKTEIENLKKQAQATEKELNEANAALSAVQADITAVNAELTAANEDKIRALGELRRIGELRENLEKALAGLKDEKQSGAQKLEELKAASTDAAKQIEEIENQKSAIQAEIDKMSGGRDSIVDRREQLTEEITGLKLGIIEHEKDIEQICSAADALEASISNRTGRLNEIAGEIATLEQDNLKLKQDIDAANNEIQNLRQQISEREQFIVQLTEKRAALEKESVEIRNRERERTLEREKIGGELARLNERKEVMLKEYDDVIRQLFDEYQLTRSEAESIGIHIEKPSEARKRLAEIKSQIRSLGNVNVSAIEEYKEVYGRYEFLSGQIADVENSRAQLYKLINQLTAQMQELFVEGFNKINENFASTFREFFGDGSANLVLSDPENVLESGINIEVKLPGKNVPSIDGFSGGEKALVALSIYFAIMRVNPPPFCFLDEVDTALDEINVDRFADYMKHCGFSTQFICVTHRRGTMEAADMLYGVTMQEKGVTKLLELNVNELEKKLLAERGA